jgi:hypothetical protein
MPHLSATDMIMAFTDRVTDTTNVHQHKGENVLLVLRGTTTTRFLEGATLALAERETGDRGAAALLAARRLLPLDRLAGALACHDHGVTATALDLGVSPRVIRRRLDNLDAAERTYLRWAITTTRQVCATAACPRRLAG